MKTEWKVFCNLLKYIKITHISVSLPNINVCLVFKKEECALAVLPLDGHVQQSLSTGHSVIDRCSWSQQLSRYGVHAWHRQIDKYNHYYWFHRSIWWRRSDFVGYFAVYLSRGPSPERSGPWSLWGWSLGWSGSCWWHVVRWLQVSMSEWSLHTNVNTAGCFAG